MGTNIKLTFYLLLLVLLLGGCIGKKKSLCVDLAEGGHAHVALGYFYDSSEATVTGPAKFTTVTDDATTHPCLRP